MAVALTITEPPHAILLRLDKRVVEELKNDSKHAHEPQLLSGPIPRLRINGVDRDLRISPASQIDLYTHTSESSAQKKSTSTASPKSKSVEWLRAGIIRSKIELKVDPDRSENDTADEVAAQAALEQSLASFEKEKQANSTHIASGVIPNSRNKQEYGRKRDLIGRRINAKTIPAVSSNTTHLTNKSSQTPIVGSGSSDPGLSEAYRKVLIHLLALGPANIDTLRKKTCISGDHLIQILPKIAAESKESDKTWDLVNRAYKELDVYKFRYRSSGDRERAVANATRAFDRLRIGKDEKIWQLLLPPEDRGKGIVVSKLNIMTNQQVLPASTPLPEPGPERKNASAAPTPRPGQSPRPNNGKTTANVTKRLFTKDPAKAQKARQLEDAKEQRRKEREATKQKVQQTSPPKGNTRPLIPSPLGARPRLASDVSERTTAPVSRTPKPSTPLTSAPADKSRKTTISTAIKPKPESAIVKTALAKRKAPDVLTTARGPIKHRKTDSVSSHSAKSTSSTNPNSTAHTSPVGAFDSGGNSDSSSSFGEALTYRQGVSLAEEFRVKYYPVYATLYDEQAAKERRGETVSRADRELLWRMHKRLERMKRDIDTASKRAPREDL